jgi:radical SAM protein (TIGR01212 family)
LVELGAQSFFNDQLEFLQRGHSAEQNIQAIEKLHTHTDADIGIHLIFGMPGDTEQRMIKTAQIVNALPISNVKLHNLHVLKNTPLATLYQQGQFTPLELEQYAERVILFLRHLSPAIAVQRLAAIANRWDELIAPQWTRQKMQPIDYIETLMAERGVFQGDLHPSS